MVTQITQLSTPPSRQRPATFSDEADVFLSELPAFGNQANQLALELNASAVQVSQDKADIVGIIADAIDTAIASSTGVAQGYANAAAQSASDADDSATQANLSKLAANQSALDAANSVQQAGDVAGASKWVAGTYNQGDAVWSPISYFTYRRTTPGSTSSTIDPFLDEAGWKRVGVQAKLAQIKKGDEVLTGGGLIGRVLKVDDTYAEVEIAQGVKVKALKSTIVDVIPPAGAKPAND